MHGVGTASDRPPQLRSGVRVAAEWAESGCATRGQERNLNSVLDEDVSQLSIAYPSTIGPEDPPILRLAGPLGLNVVNSVQLGDEIYGDLDVSVYGIGWWKAYPDLDRKTRILLSDYLMACVRAVPDNLVEAQVERLELDHAIEDFRQWMNRGMGPAGRSTVKAPQNPYEDLSNYRVGTHLAGALRAWGSALDCVGGCIEAYSRRLVEVQPDNS
jgi:hypothetical protein